MRGDGEDSYQTPTKQKEEADELTESFEKLTMNVNNRVAELKQTVCRLENNECWLLEKVQRVVAEVLRKATAEKLRFRAMLYAFAVLFAGWRRQARATDSVAHRQRLPPQWAVTGRS